ncbi:hypothetical protein RRF57_004186 [Xylaria bambusicola]|uniref:Pre-mRNA-splicing factor CWC24 n=1 Tax=Xylaria bambusicola TaxID=326684 RepID=A0AAN7ULI0_9PEZI
MDSTTPAAPAAPDTGNVASPPPVIFKSRGMRAKANLRKRAAPVAAPSNAKGSSDNSSDNSGSSSDERPSVAKRRRHDNRGITSISANRESTSTVSPATFEADRKVPLTDTNDATKRSDWYDEPTKKGPVRSSTNVRMTITTDFAPDVCKDYKKTGWCGFGDSCIFLHDRSDMKQGWQLDREWEMVAKGRNDLGGTVVSSAAQKSKDKANGKVSKAGSNNQTQDEDDEKMLEKIPFVCIICEKPYKSPIVTRCGHYFCEPCALKRYREDPSCKNCGAATGGVFNAATRLERLLKRKREAQIET